MTTLTVGSGQQYATIAAAVAASHDGDVLAVKAGTYVNDFATIGTKITIQGVGGMVNLVATASPPNRKGILVTNTDVTIKNLSFSGAEVPDGNGAGIRYQAGNLTIENSLFHDNQNGLLGNPNATGTITIRNSEFAHNGAGDGKTHNIYVGEIAKLTIDDSYFHDAVVGHQIKSRAHQTVITDSRIVDGAAGTGSYSVDIPNGGKATLTGNTIVQGPHSQNPAMVHFGGEGTPYAGSSLQMSGNSFLNELSSSSARMLLNHTGATASVTGNSVYGLTTAQYATGPASVSGVTVLATEPAVSGSPPWNGSTAPTPTPTPTPAPTPTPNPVPAPTPAPVPAPSGTTGTAGNDTIVLKAALGGKIDLLGGTDSLTLSSAGANHVTVSNAEVIRGGTAADSVTLGAGAPNLTVDLGGGTDKLTLSSAGANRVTADHVETILGGSAADTVTLAHAATGITADLGTGKDKLALASGGPNTLTVANAETILGGNAADTITLAKAAAGISVDLGAGTDKLVLSSAGPNTLTVMKAEAINGGAAADSVTLAKGIIGLTVDLGAGKDMLALANSANTATALNTEVIKGGIAADDITLGGAVSGITVDLGASADKLTLSSAGPNTLTAAGVETLTGGAAADRVAFTTVIGSGKADLGGGSDSLTLANGMNTLAVSGVEQVTGGTGMDRITATGSTATTLKGGAGNDVLAGGSGADTLVGGAGSDTLSGGAGADRFTFAAGSSTPAAPDRILDFNPNGDLLVFEGQLEGHFTFRGAGAFTGHGSSEARFVAGTQQLQVDANGDGAADTAVTLSGVNPAQLSSSDFVWN